MERFADTLEEKHIQPWIQVASFFFTVALATKEQWSALGLAWNFWVAGLLLGLIHIVTHFGIVVWRQKEGTSRPGDDLAGIAMAVFVLIFAYSLFAGFLDTLFAFMAFDMGKEMPNSLSSVCPSIANAVRLQYGFLIASGFSLLPRYIQDAFAVSYTNLTKPIFSRELLRMIILIFLLVALSLAQLGMFSIYAVLLVYFLPTKSLRRLLTKEGAMDHGGEE